ncbi:acyl-CoA N-acyltransferase [Nemania sp. NC0429]|nr:acyl-CoA N-acyltransferase [Nemania sp. NC0429]
MSIRYATPSDLDAIAWIAVAASPADPVFTYRYPYMDQYPEDYAKYTRIRYSENFANPDNVVMVYECPSIEDPSIIKPVAFAVWLLPSSQRPAQTGGVEANQQQLTNNDDGKQANRLERRDANPARWATYHADALAAKQRLFEEPFGDRQLYLGMLECHPDYQRRGAGGMLVAWGINKARADKLTLTLFASPMGARLYKRLGFRDVGTFRTQVPGEDEYLDSRAMVLDYE